MGSSVVNRHLLHSSLSLFLAMAPMKKVAAKAMTKGAIAQALADACEVKKTVAAKALDVLLRSRVMQVQTQNQTSDEGWQEGSVRQGGDGQGEASEEDCQSIPSRSLEGQHLMS